METICIPKSLKDHIPLQKRGTGYDSEYGIIFILCFVIPAVFVVIIFTLVVFAKKNVEKSELRRAQNTNASSLSSMNFSSKNLLYSRGTYNGSNNRSGNRSGVHNENPMDYTPKSNPIEMGGINNVNMNGINYNMVMPNNLDGINKINNGNETLDFNKQLLIAKNYRIPDFGTNSLSRTSNSLSRTPNSLSRTPNSLPRTPIQASPMNSPYIQGQQFRLDSPRQLTTAIIKEESVKDYNGHTHELPSIPVNEESLNNKKSQYKKEKYNNMKMTHRPQQNQYGYDKSYNDIKKAEQRVSVSPPLRDWNDSYTIDESKNKDSYNAKNDYYNRKLQAVDSLSRNYKQSPHLKYPSEYVMAISPPKNQSISEKEKINIIEQYDNSDGYSTNSSHSYNSEKYKKGLPYKNYAKKYRE
ncbi:hypothetical protein BCR36DRAFT_586105 [Piromyces finnis]|uniref:Uncharacterized protein n=1 Tax=Piromyces finnis TaxID=1754191 RepID=A0A1Y1V0E8_9FUNG|nr:hypothetical protein BCR36DRAFT_586105 [Piromyces finnis]|eukprot:ORX44486.1 hypothetical protein BCR36DRAFT_586105 [Piromyces finnis]